MHNLNHTPVQFEVETYAGADSYIRISTYSWPIERQFSIANLITEARDVATETGMAPRQLADSHKELLEALEFAFMEMCGQGANSSTGHALRNAYIKARAAISKAKRYKSGD